MLIILLLIVIDQVIKVWVKTNMHLGETIDITSWFKILFIENNGMAYGMTFINKIVLTSFRIIASVVIAYYIYKVVRKPHRIVYLVCLSLVFAGAVGNIFDCLFYGQVFTESSHWTVAETVPFGQGYGPILQGRVVDMFYFPLWHWPEWMPLVGGNVFFSPVFNFADSCISVGVVALILFCRKDMETIGETLLEGTPFEKKQETTEKTTTENSENKENAEE